RGECTGGHEPEAAEDEEQQREDQRERADGVGDALAANGRFGLDRDAMSSGKLDPERRQSGVARIVAGLELRDLSRDRIEARKERVREHGIGRRPARLRDDESPASVLRRVTVLTDTDVDAALRAAHLIAQEIEKAKRILANELRD